MQLGLESLIDLNTKKKIYYYDNLFKDTFLVVFSFFEKKLPIVVTRDVCPSVRLSVCRLRKKFLFAVIRYLTDRLLSKSA